MIGIIIIISVVGAFVKKAKEKNENKWKWGVLALISYYGGTFFAAFMIGLFVEMGFFNLDLDNEIKLTFLSLPFGVTACYFAYRLLDKKETKKPNIDDFGTIEENKNTINNTHQ